MQYRTLGRTDLKVSSLCLGTMTWGRQNTQQDAFAQMDYALQQGVNFFDTAELYAVPPTPDTYGKTEAMIGNWFEARGNRAQVILASKVAGPGIGWIRGGDFMTPDAITCALEDSLKRLKTDYIDLYQLHWPNRGSYAFLNHWGYKPAFDKAEVEANMIAVLETLDACMKAGKIRHVGLSNETAWGSMRYLQLAEKHGLPRMVSVQNEYSLLDRLFDLDMQEVAIAEDLGLLAWSPLATGMLSGKYLDGARPEGSRWTLSGDTAASSRRDTPAAQKAVASYRDIAAQHGLDVCQMALAFVLSRPFVTSAIIGATSMEQLHTNIQAHDLTLPPAILSAIAAVHRETPWPF